MSDVAYPTKRFAWGERWSADPRRPGRATLYWAVAHGGFALASALDAPLSGLNGGRGPVGLGWFAFGAAVLAGAGAVAVLRGDGRPAVRVVLRVACGLSVLTAFALLMDVVTLLFGQGVDDPPVTVLRVLGALGAVLLAATAHAHRAVAHGSRRRAGALTRPRPSPASRRVHLAAYGGTAAFLPYAAMKLTWVLGGTFAGTSGAEMHAAAERNGASGLWLTLESWGVDGTVLLAAIGVFLLFGLVRPWGQVFPRWTLVLSGRRVPRWLPLTPAVLGAATLVPYGIAGIGYLTLATAGAVDIRRGDFASSADALQVGWIGFGAFAGYGVALLIAARSYWTRTRPVPASGADGGRVRAGLTR
ncbi:hypothetical protein [Streptomyces sp. I05A-00742]|uniref:hypothetical protein n=1 Tax=Streptomyces sp. I05A-00742 TaxID=2732853 RepID=UPI0020175396|nr:hypothetical protein [Streptomyces sp. I05A-00742]